MGVIRRLARWAGVAGVAGVAVLALSVAAVLYLSDRNLRAHGYGRALEAPVDAVLVLGGGVDGDGVLGYSSRRRVFAAVALLREGRADHLIFSGGPHDEPGIPSSASLMRAHALALGAPADALLIEERAGSTFENLRFGFALADERGFERLAIATDAFHLARARLLAAYLGRADPGLIAVGGLARERPETRVWSPVREALAWWYNLAKLAGWEALGALGLEEEARGEWIR